MGLVPLSRGCLNFYHIANIFFCFPFCAVCLSDKVATPNAKKGNKNNNNNDNNNKN